MPMPPASRRALLVRSAGLIAATSAPAWLMPARAQGQTLRPTPSQTEGPYYPARFPADTDAALLRTGTARYGKGQAAWVTGTVTDTRGTPLGGGVIEIWQCDQDGHYHHPGDGDRADPAFQGFGQVTLGRDGRYRFRTLKPAPYSGRTPHIHVKVRLDGETLLTTQFYVQGDPGNARDFLWRRLDAQAQAALTRPFVNSSDGLTADYPVVVQA